MATNRRGRATRDLLVDTADELLAERGLDVTLEEIATAAGVTRQTVHRHFGDRGALITAAVLRASQTLGDELTELLDRDAPFPERLADVIVVTVRSARANPSIRALLTRSNPATAWPDLDRDNRFVDAASGFFRGALQRAVDDGELVLRADLDLTVDWLLRQLLSLMTVSSALGDDDDAVRREVRTFLWHAISRGPVDEQLRRAPTHVRPSA